MSSLMSDDQFWENMRRIDWKGELKIDAFDDACSIFHAILMWEESAQFKCDLMEKALEMGANINVFSNNVEGNGTPLMVATKAPSHEVDHTWVVSKWLIEHGADVNMLDGDSEHVGFWALISGQDLRVTLAHLVPLYIDAGLNAGVRSAYSGEKWEDYSEVRPIIDAFYAKKLKEKLCAALPKANHVASSPKPKL